MEKGELFIKITKQKRNYSVSLRKKKKTRAFCFLSEKNIVPFFEESEINDLIFKRQDLCSFFSDNKQESSRPLIA